MCIRRAINDEAIVEPTAEQEDFCESKLDSCDCSRDKKNVDLNTSEGKLACGLAL